MAYIYMIVNKFNNKKYIGQTRLRLEDRWKMHLIDAVRPHCANRPLYKAINTYGADSFDLHILETCEISEMDDKEKFWIAYYNTYNDGYNATLGGCGKPFFNYNDIKALIQKGMDTDSIVKSLGCCADVVRIVARQNNLTLPSNSGTNFKMRAKPVTATSKDNKQKIIFNSIADGARFVADDNTKVNNLKGMRSHITECCQHKRKSAYGFRWEYMEE